MASFGVFSALLLAAIGCGGALTVYRDLSFSPPFTQFDSDGARRVQNWQKGNAAEIFQNYIRVTNDRQGRRGYLWSSQNMGHLAEWSLTFRFRISGQGKRLFGDGMALWFTTHPLHREGPAHGFTDTFKGFGVILDTYVNTDPGHVHKDVLLITSDGKAPKLAPHGGPVDDHPTGCEADFRFWEGRGDFNVTSRSALRVLFRNNHVSIWIDPRNDGKAKQCVKDIPVSAESDWWRTGAYLGISATTGDLADNHDALSLLVTAEDDWAPEETASGAPPLPPFVSTGNSQMDAAIQAASAREMALMNEQLALIQHQFEHTLAAVHDNTAMKKVSESEASLEKRVADIEARIEKRVSDSVVQKIETSVGSAMHKRVADVLMPSIEAKLKGVGQGWRIPFVILLVFVGALATMAILKYRKLLKTHLL